MRVFHRAGWVRVSNFNATEQRLQVKAREGHRRLGRKRILAMLVIVVTTTLFVPECVKQAGVMRLSSVWAEWRVLDMA